MPIDKSWIDSPRHSPHYKQGLESFIKMCERVIKNHNEVRCPCNVCKNSGLIDMALMKRHLRISSFWKDYTKWTHHGETTPVAGVDDVAPQDGMGNVIEDVRGERMEEDTYLNQQNSNGDSGGVRDDFEDLVKEAETELYPDCTKYSSIDFLAKLMNVKEFD